MRWVYYNFLTGYFHVHSVCSSELSGFQPEKSNATGKSHLLRFTAWRQLERHQNFQGSQASWSPLLNTHREKVWVNTKYPALGLPFALYHVCVLYCQWLVAGLYLLCTLSNIVHSNSALILVINRDGGGSPGTVTTQGLSKAGKVGSSSLLHQWGWSSVVLGYRTWGRWDASYRIAAPLCFSSRPFLIKEGQRGSIQRATQVSEPLLTSRLWKSACWWWWRMSFTAARREDEARGRAPQCSSWSAHHFRLGVSTISPGAVPLSHRGQVNRGGKIQTGDLSLGFAGKSSKQQTGNLVTGHRFPRWKPAHYHVDVSIFW